MLKYLAEGEAEAFKLDAGEAPGHAPGTDAGVEEALVSVDVADAGQQRLIQQGGFDGQAATPKKCSKGLGINRQWLVAGTLKDRASLQVFEGEAPEAARIDEAELAAAQKSETRVGMRRDRCGRIGHQQAAGHAQVDDPLSLRKLIIARWFFPSLAGARRAKFADNVFAGAVNGEKNPAYQAAGQFRRRSFERLMVRAEPDIDNAVPAHPLVDAAGDSLHFGELGHRSIIAGRRTVNPPMRQV